ncbi:MAG: hypothetical protein ISS95_00560 [Candidatus Aenigmarchaeota archaeon]|nr:hypothetical protein [Candidatus Aenigmarchaeota archaeon]
MFMVSKKCCPSCGVEGNRWEKNSKVLKCPICSTIFSEFGFVTLGKEQEAAIS